MPPSSFLVLKRHAKPVRMNRDAKPFCAEKSERVRAKVFLDSTDKLV
jgi:hypothetical protein